MQSRWRKPGCICSEAQRASRVCVPLPLQAKHCAVEFVTSLRHGHGPHAPDIGLSVHQHRLALPRAAPVLSDDRPVVAPFHRFEVNDAPVSAPVLEMEEPVLARLRIDPCSLVRSVDPCTPLVQHDSVLVRAMQAFRSEDGLVAGANPTRGREHVIIAIALVEFRALEGRPSRDLVSVDDDLAGIERTSPVRTQPVQCQKIRNTGTAPGPGVDEVKLAIVVPERAWIDQPPAGLDYPISIEKHFTPDQLGKMWNFSGSTIRDLFREEPGVLIIDRPEKMHKRGYCSMRIPASVAERVHQRLCMR